MTASIRDLPRALGVIVPLAALALVGCSTQQYASDVAGTTPPVWTGSTSPGADAHHSSDDHDSEEGDAHLGEVVELISPDGTSIGTVGSTRHEGEVEVEVEVEAGSGLAPGTYAVAFHTNAICDRSAAAENDAQFPFESAGDELIIDGAPVAIDPLTIGADGSGKLSFTADVPPGSVIIDRTVDGAQQRQACAVVS